MSQQTAHVQDIIRKGILPMTGGEFEIHALNSGHIETILALQQDVYDSFPAAEKTFLLLRNREFFEKHFARRNHIIGLLHEGKLIAQSVAVTPYRGAPQKSTGIKPSKSVIIQGVVVHPLFRGNRLMNVMLEECLNLAEKSGRVHAKSRVHIDNQVSLNAFVKLGFKVQSIDLRPNKDAFVYNLYGHIPDLARNNATRSTASGVRAASLPEQLTP